MRKGRHCFASTRILTHGITPVNTLKLHSNFTGVKTTHRPLRAVLVHPKLTSGLVGGDSALSSWSVLCKG